MEINRHGKYKTKISKKKRERDKTGQLKIVWNKLIRAYCCWNENKKKELI